MQTWELALIIAASVIAVLGLCIYICLKPKHLGDGVYNPSLFTQMTFTSSKSDYSNESYPKTYTGDLKVLVVCTEKGDMPMANGKVFHTGNHPVETLLPMLHMKAAGFEFDIATATGKPVVFEQWALPTKDEVVMGLYTALSGVFEKPLKLSDVSDTLEGYAAIFLPGGHGALLGLQENAKLGQLLRNAHSSALPTISLCHGPGTLLAAAVGADAGEPYAYAGYKMMVFPDKVDKFTPKLGYLPGGMPIWIGEVLTEHGVTVLNADDNIDGRIHTDRELLTGDSPLASNNVGKAAAALLLEKYAGVAPADVAVALLQAAEVKE